MCVCVYIYTHTHTHTLKADTQLVGTHTVTSVVKLLKHLFP